MVHTVRLEARSTVRLNSNSGLVKDPFILETPFFAGKQGKKNP